MNSSFFQLIKDFYNWNKNMINDFIKSFSRRALFYIIFPMIYIIVGTFMAIVNTFMAKIEDDSPFDLIFWSIKWIILPLVVLAFINTIREFTKRKQQYNNIFNCKRKIEIENKGKIIVDNYNLILEKIINYKKFILLSSLNEEIEKNLFIAKDLQSSIILLSIFDSNFKEKSKEILQKYNEIEKEYMEHSKLLDKLLNENQNAIAVFTEYFELSQSTKIIIDEFSLEFKDFFSYDEFSLLLDDLNKIKNDLDLIYNEIVTSDNLEMASNNAIHKIKEIKNRLPNKEIYVQYKQDLSSYIKIEKSIYSLTQTIFNYQSQYNLYLNNHQKSELLSFKEDLENILNQMYKNTRQDSDFYQFIFDEYYDKFINFKEQQSELIKIYEFNELKNFDKKKSWVLENGYFSLLFENNETKELVNFLDDLTNIKVFIETDAKKLSLFSLEQSNDSKWSAFYAQLTGYEEKDEIVSLLRMINDNRYFKPVKNFVLSQKSDLTEEQRELVRKLTTLQLD